MITSTTTEQIDARTNYIPHFVSPPNQEKLASLQIQFLERKKKTTTIVASLIVAILALHMVLEIDRPIILGLIFLTTLYCWRKYCSLCKCPNCEISLVTSKDKWRMPVAGFSTSICPRCEVKLIRLEHGSRMTDAQARKVEIMKISKRF